MRVSGESLFSQFNNVKIYSVVSNKYNEYFGFTKKETEELLEYYGLELNDEVNKMYDGYNFNGLDIYNPWSILNYAEEGKILPYWSNTSRNSLIKDILINSDIDTRISIEKLIQGESLEFTYDEKITFNDLAINNYFDTIANFLLVSGYLTIDDGDKIKIPNGETREVYIKILNELIVSNNEYIGSNQIRELNKAIINNDKETIERILNMSLMSLSYFDTYENYYHGYVLGLFTYFLNDDNYILKSNRIAGVGRFDVMIERTDRTLGIILEFKISETDKIEESALEALEQIEKRRYYEELIQDKVENIYKYGIVFSKDKKCIVR